jgi:osmoprotectant transport system ATP-binding protein
LEVAEAILNFRKRDIVSKKAPSTDTLKWRGCKHLGTLKPMPISLAARNVSHHFGNVAALDGVSIDVPAGRAVALVGESGSGKTTLLRCFNRLVEPEQGEVKVGDNDVRAQPAVQLRRGIGYVQQHGGLLPHWRVLRNVALVPVLQGMSDPVGAAQQALELVGLPSREFGARFPHELSGGQRQRVALARSIAARPGVVLLDEPFGALDAISRGELHESFDQLRRSLSVTTLLVTHDLAEAARLADDIVVMKKGRIEQMGSMRTLITAPATEYVAQLIARARAGLEALRA